MAHDELFTVADGPVGADGEPAPVFILRVAQGPEAGQSLLLDWSSRPAYLIGQGPLCDLRLSDRRVSRRHLRLAPEGALLRLSDLGSSNGTSVGGLRVVEALLSGGELVTIGDTQLRVARAPVGAAVPPAKRTAFGRVLGGSFEMQRLFELAEKLAASNLPIVIEGETGTGKELLAEAIHDAGLRATASFVVFDCAGPVASIERRLFGGEEPGAIEQAHGGTLVLSELGDLDLGLQARLVAVVERGVVTRGADARRVDVRLIATSRRDTDRDVQEGRLREDLMFRLAGARLEVPPLRRRYGDIPTLVEHFWGLYRGEGQPPKSLLLRFARSAWPGNVRELQHAVARAVALGSDEVEALGSRLPAPSSEPEKVDILAKALEMDLPLPSARQIVVREFEKRYVEQALARHNGNVTRAAAASGLTRRYFHVLLAELRGGSGSGG